VFDPARDYDPGARAFYVRLGTILTIGVIACALMLLYRAGA
jgi:hypothetical protein